MTKKTISILLALVAALWFTSSMVFAIQAYNNPEKSTTLVDTPTPESTHIPNEIRQLLPKKQLEGINKSSGSSPVRGTPRDLWADVVIGQPSFGQITPNRVVGNKLFNPGGVFVDRSKIPNLVYIYDAGNSRIMGFSSLGVCAAGTKVGQKCTSTSDCPGSECTIDEDKFAEIIIGQVNSSQSTCNGDSGMQHYPDFPTPSANTLCGIRPDSISILEGGSMATMATDSQGNLYHVDYFNNRVLRFNKPFENDSVADFVWGQTDFTQGNCNQGRSYGSPDNKSLCLVAPLQVGSIRSGVAIDSTKNLWVTDTQNNRVLRFSYDSILGAPTQEADLVLGQPNFSTATSGTGVKQMNNPGSVRVDTSGNVYILDGMDGWGNHGRLLVFHPPLSNGMAANHVFAGLGEPTGLELDPNGTVWINNSGQGEILHLLNDNLQTVINGIDKRLEGGLGIDRDNKILLTGWDPQEVLIYSPSTSNLTSTFLKADEYGSFNKLGSQGMTDPIGLEVTDSQLMIADGSRLLFWNDPSKLSNSYLPADGVVGQPNFTTRPRWGPTFGRMRADTNNNLWVIREYNSSAKILAYKLPLVNGAEPVNQISSPIALLGGGNFSWTWSLKHTGIFYQPECDCLWLSDRDYNRIFRIRNVSSENRVVDIVLGQKQNPNTLEIGTHCNQGRDSDDLYIHPTSPSQDSLCHPGGLAMDSRGNLYVSDHNLEIAGNWRLLEYDASNLPISPETTLFDIPASRVFGRNGSFTESACVNDDPMCGSWEPVFYPDNQMIVGFNTYLGSNFPQIYQDPLTNPLPYTLLMDFYSHAYSARLDSLNNLYVLDHTRNHVLIYHAISYTISGNTGVDGVNLSYKLGTVRTITSDSTGFYEITLPSDWSGKITPSKASYGFTPASRSYENILANQTNQNYTALTLPGDFSKIKPINNANNQPNNTTLSWGVSSDAISYEYCIDTTNNNACNDTWISTGIITSKTLSSLTPGGTYYWQVRAKNAVGTTRSNSGTWWGFTVTKVPGAFKKIIPANGKIDQLTHPTLTWGDSIGASAYYYCIDKTNDNTCTTWVNNGITTSKALSGLSPNTLYYWHVKVVNSFGTTFSNGGSINFWSFKTGAKPQAFNKTAPALGASEQPANITLEWGASTGAKVYYYCIDETNDNSCNIWVNNSAATNKALTDLSPGTTYYWHVKATNMFGTTFSDGSSIVYWSFSTK